MQLIKRKNKNKSSLDEKRPKNTKHVPVPTIPENECETDYGNAEPTGKLPVPISTR